MDAVQAMTGQGGWPMTVFLTPDGEPFYGGTYFPQPPRPRAAGVPRRAGAASPRRGGHAATSSRSRPTSSPRRSRAARRAPAWRPVVERGVGGAEERHRTAAVARCGAPRRRWPRFDRANGGWGGAPKFPQAMTIEFLLREHAPDRRRASRSAMARADARRDGRRRHPRPARRRLPRYATDARVARAALREDALRQRAAGARLPRTPGWLTRRAAVRGGGASTRSTSWRASCARRRRASRRAWTPTPTGDEGATYVWPQPRSTRRSGDERALFSAAYGVTAERQLGGDDHPVPGADDAELATRFGMTPTRSQALARARRTCSSDARDARSRTATTR